MKVLLNGATGKMGVVTEKTLTAAEDTQLVAALNRSDNLAEALSQHSPDVVVDFTHPEVVYDNLITIVQHGVRPVIGTTGLTLEQIQQVETLCAENKLGGAIIPNFSISAILMMKFAQMAVKYLPDAEIIELHHPQKADAPSGTALKTAEMMHQANQQAATVDPTERPAARGKLYQGIPIHSVRLPGLFSHQEVLLAGAGELLTVRHDGFSREAMMPGVLLACRQVMQLDHLVYGLENFL